MPHPLVVCDPQIMLGKPVIASTRITVEAIRAAVAAGETVDDLLTAHPRLTREGTAAALAVAADVLCSEVVRPAPTPRSDSDGGSAC